MSDVTASLLDDPAEDGPRDRRRRKLLWVLVLLLLLALVACGIVQFMFPTLRGTIGKDSLHGMVSVYSIYGLHQPLGVGAGPDGEVAVADTGVQKALLFSSVGDLTSRFGSDDASDRVFGIDGIENHDGLWYLSDWILRRVWVFDDEGQLVDYFPQDPTSSEFGESGFAPYDVAFAGGEILVTTASSIERFSVTDFSHLGSFGEAQPGGIGLSYPNGIAVDPGSGRVFVCDVLNRRVVAFESDGGVAWILGVPDEAGQIVSFFSLPRGITVCERGVLVADTFKHQLVLLDADGRFLGTYGSRGVIDLQFNFPEGLATAPDGLIYVADRENNRVQVVALRDPVEPTSEAMEKWRASFSD